MVNYLKRYNNPALSVLLPKIAFLLSCLPLIMPTHMTGMKHSQELNSYEVTSLVNLPEDIAIIIAANCEAQDSLRETCKYFDAFISKNKETILKHGLLRLNEKALTNFLGKYVAAGKSEVVRNLLEHGANPNACDDKKTLYDVMQRIANEIRSGNHNLVAMSFASESLLLVAIRNGYSTIVQSLIDHKADITVKDNDNQTLLHYASKLGHSEMVTSLLDNGANVNEKDGNDVTSLHYASEQGHVHVIEILLAHGANININDIRDKTPLHYASENGQAQAVEILLHKGALIDAADAMGFTALHHASQKRHLAVVKKLLDNEANIKQGDNNGFIPLYMVSNIFYCNGDLEEEVMKKLLIARIQKPPVCTPKNFIYGCMVSLVGAALYCVFNYR